MVDVLQGKSHETIEVTMGRASKPYDLDYCQDQDTTGQPVTCGFCGKQGEYPMTGEPDIDSVERHVIGESGPDATPRRKIDPDDIVPISHPNWPSGNGKG